MYPPPRHLIKRFLPTPGRIKALRLNRYFGDRVNDPRLWIVRRQTVSKATAIGLFCAYMPMPMEMLLAALLAILIRANLPISVTLVWLSNPFTWLVVYTPPYLLGLAILGETHIQLNDITLQMMSEQLLALWIGCLIFGLALAIAGYVLANVIWSMMIRNRWNNRWNLRKLKKASSKKD